MSESVRKFTYISGSRCTWRQKLWMGTRTHMWDNHSNDNNNESTEVQTLGVIRI